MNTITGQTTVLSGGGFAQSLLSPDGSEVATTSGTGLSLINTSDGITRQLAPPILPQPNGSYGYWRGVTRSSDGSKFLANRFYYASEKVVFPTTTIQVINVATAAADKVTDGTAYGWYQPNW